MGCNGNINIQSSYRAEVDKAQGSILHNQGIVQPGMPHDIVHDSRCPEGPNHETHSGGLQGLSGDTEVSFEFRL